MFILTILPVPLPSSSLGGTFTSISVQVVEVQAQKSGQYAFSWNFIETSTYLLIFSLLIVYHSFVILFSFGFGFFLKIVTSEQQTNEM